MYFNLLNAFRDVEKEKKELRDYLLTCAAHWECQNCFKVQVVSWGSYSTIEKCSRCGEFSRDWYKHLYHLQMPVFMYHNKSNLLSENK